VIGWEANLLSSKGYEVTSIGANPGRRPRWVMRAATAVLVAGSLAAVAADVSAAQAAPNTTHRLKVVKVVTRRPFGKMLATTGGRSLYYIPSNRCNKACLAFWPPLLMPKNSRAIPTGVSCLSTLRFGKGGRQVAYRGHRLYTFVGDHGTSVRGNHVQRFLVARVSAGGCPLQVVKVVSRRPVGKMLATTANPGASLYYLPTGTCGASCQSSWPPLVLPKGSTAVPTGVTCLGTAKLGLQRQITYRGHRLYTFVGDSGSSVNGDGFAGFVAARVQTSRCPR
jgi:predicted lipoprotein with Yx(FWY)xxD motif